MKRLCETSRSQRQNPGNQSEAAKILDVDRPPLYRKLEEYKIKS